MDRWSLRGGRWGMIVHSPARRWQPHHIAPSGHGATAIEHVSDHEHFWRGTVYYLSYWNSKCRMCCSSSLILYNTPCSRVNNQDNMLLIVQSINQHTSCKALSTTGLAFYKKASCYTISWRWMKAFQNLVVYIELLISQKEFIALVLLGEGKMLTCTVASHKLQ